jgi:hypothetical protein
MYSIGTTETKKEKRKCSAGALGSPLPLAVGLGGATGKEGLAVLGVVLHGGLSRVPVSRADLPKLIVVLNGLDHTEGLVNRPANGHVVDGDVADEPLGVNHKETPINKTRANHRRTKQAQGEVRK